MRCKRFKAVCPTSRRTRRPSKNDLESIVTPYDRNDGVSKLEWPRFLFPLADPVQLTAGPLPPAKADVTESTDPITKALDRIDNFVALIAAALPAQTTEATPPPLLASQPVMNIGAPTYFVIRCVFERPNCGPLQPTVVSDPTEPFLMAGFFDPDAPARPIRIALPIDTTPAGLRKFDKNTAFMISDVLCGQITRAQGLGFGRSHSHGFAVAAAQRSRRARRRAVRRRRRALAGHDLLVVDSHHHHLRVDPVDDHGESIGHHLPVGAVFHHVSAVPEIQEESLRNA